MRNVSQTADAERNLPAVLRKLCVHCENYLLVGVAGVLRSTSPHWLTPQLPGTQRQIPHFFVADVRSEGGRTQTARRSDRHFQFHV